MTVRQLFYACENFQYGDTVTIKDANKVLYESTFMDALTTVYAEYKVRRFNYKTMCIEVF
jgi:hypothetical protein